MPYRDVASLAARVDELEAKCARVRARARRLARHYRARRLRLVRGLFLVALPFGLVSAYAFFVRPCGCEPVAKQAANDAVVLQMVAEKWRVDHPASPCPTPEGLRYVRELSPGSKLTDPWDNPYEIRCEGASVYAASAGADRKLGTLDDIVR